MQKRSDAEVRHDDLPSPPPRSGRKRESHGTDVPRGRIRSKNPRKNTEPAEETLRPAPTETWRRYRSNTIDIGGLEHEPVRIEVHGITAGGLRTRLEIIPRVAEGVYLLRGAEVLVRALDEDTRAIVIDESKGWPKGHVKLRIFVVADTPKGRYRFQIGRDRSCLPPPNMEDAA